MNLGKIAYRAFCKALPRGASLPNYSDNYYWDAAAKAVARAAIKQMGNVHIMDDFGICQCGLQKDLKYRTCQEELLKQFSK